MKKITLLFCSLLISISVFASQTPKKGISLQIKSDTLADIVQVLRIEKGASIIAAEFSLKPGEEKLFQDNLVHGFYLVKFQKNAKKVYATSDKMVSIVIKGKNSIEIVKPGKANALLEKWFEISDEARHLSVAYQLRKQMNKVIQRDNFYNAQRALEKESTAYIAKLKNFKEDPFFAKAMQVLVKNEINYFKLFYIQIPLIGKVDRQTLPKDLYESIYNSDLNEDPIMLLVNEDSISYIFLNGAWNQYSENKNAKPHIIEYTKSPEVQVAYLLDNANRKKDGTGLKLIERRYLHLFKEGYPLEELNKLRKEYAFLMDPNKAPDFDFKNSKGKIVKLSDFKNKLIVVDVWATWCGPCKANRPYFEELSKEMKDQNIAFIAVSVDESEMKWHQYVEKLESIELLDLGKKFSGAYGITSIPKYMIFDSKGKLLEGNAPRPGKDGLLKKMLLDYLAKS